MHTVKRILCAMCIAIIAVGYPLCAEAQFSPPVTVLLSAASVGEGKPRVIVESCSVADGGLISDAVCEVKITLRNTSASMAVSSVLVTGRWPNDNPPPVDFEMTNQEYVSAIGPTQTRNVVFSVRTKPVNITALDTVPLHLDIVYSYDQSPDNLNTVLIQLPVSKDLSGQPELPDDESLDIAERPASLPFLGDLRFIYMCGSILCALIAGLLIWPRFRRQ